MDLFFHHARECHWIGCRAHHQGRAALRFLSVRKVDGGAGLFVQTLMLYVTGHADNLVRSLASPLHENMLADRVLVGKMLARHRLVDYRDWRLPAAIPLAEQASFDQRYTHCRKISGRYDRDKRGRFVAWFGLRFG